MYDCTTKPTFGIAPLAHPLVEDVTSVTTGKRRRGTEAKEHDGRTASRRRIEQAPEVEDKGLKKGAIGYLSNIVIGVASTAPAYSLAATLGFIVAVKGIGVHAPAVLLVAFIPMLLVALGLQIPQPRRPRRRHDIRLDHARVRPA